MAFTMKTVLRGTTVANKTPSTSAATRVAPVVRASAEESRRQVLGGLVAGVGLLAARGAQALENITLRDDRKAVDKGFNLIYEARDLDLPQSTRDGLDQFRGSLEETKSRLAESVSRIKSDVKPKIEKAYWVAGREELRRQIGTMRFDLNSLASAKGSKAEKKAAKAAVKSFINEVETLDFALRSKDKEAALAAFDKTTTALDAALAIL